MRHAIKLLAVVAAVAGTVLGPVTDAQAIIGRPLTPFSYAGVARRTVRRSAYLGAAYGAAAYGAAAYPVPVPMTAPPAGCAPGVNCGGVVYQPVYQGGTVVYAPQQ
jgi:hypothetical protein